MGWSFCDYISASGAQPIRKALDAIPDAARARIDDRLGQMRDLDVWSPKWASAYKGRPGIIELRIKASDVQYRPLGMHHPTKRMTFVLLNVAIEKGDEIRASELDVAEKRRKEVLTNPNQVIPHDY